MDSLPDPLEVLVATSDASRTDGASEFVAAEANVALHALSRGRQAFADGDVLAGRMYLRLLSETAILARSLP
jgi:hypothetical protein